MTTNCNKIKSTEAQCRYVLVIEKSDIWDMVLPNFRRQNWYPNPRVIYKSNSNKKCGPMYRWDRCRVVDHHWLLWNYLPGSISLGCRSFTAWLVASLGPVLGPGDRGFCRWWPSTQNDLKHVMKNFFSALRRSSHVCGSQCDQRHFSVVQIALKASYQGPER